MQRATALLPFAPLAVAAALVPLIASHAGLLISIAAGVIEACNPYAPDCVSISKASREMPANAVFKMLMLPYCVMMMAYWHRLGAALDAKAITQWRRGITPCGMIAAACLSLYVLALGVEGDEFRLLRKIGVVLAFTLTYMAQLLLGRCLWRHRADWPNAIPLLMLQWSLLVTMLLMGLVTVYLDATMADYDRYEDAFEWWLAILLYLYFASTAALPRLTGTSHTTTG